MSRIFGLTMTLIFVILSSLTSLFLWATWNWRVMIQTLLILITATIGENHVSSQGYYFYTKINGVFVRRVPLWIPFMWVAACQTPFVLALLLGLRDLPALLFASTFSMTMDLVFIEPIFSRAKGLWLWTPVEKGYFSFVPPSLNRFTAPVGNYLVWFVYPLLTNCFLCCLGVIFPL